MKALRWYARNDLRLDEVLEPYPQEGQVKVKITLAGICGSDLREYSSGPHLIDINKIPLTIGHEFVGTVVETRGNVNGLRVNDRVTGLCYWVCGRCYFCKKANYNLCINKSLIGASVDGCMAEYMVTSSSSLQKLPDSVSDELGALVEPLSVAMHAVCKGNVQGGDKVCVVGDGTIGLCTLLAAKLFGASEVYLVSKHKSRGLIAAAMGATKVIDLNVKDVIRSIKDLTDGLGADITFDCVGNQYTPQLSMDLSRRGGITVIVGAYNSPALLNFDSMLHNEKSLVSSNTYVQESAMAIAKLTDKKINPSHLITAIIPFEEAVEKGFKQLSTNKNNDLKILLRIS
jgi:(R,R)-butanediol dehydrogenase / meso-butanediol dehydrogenase / diacetyl reductase